MGVAGVASTQPVIAAWCSPPAASWGMISTSSRAWLPPLPAASSRPALLAHRHLVRGRALQAFLPLDTSIATTTTDSSSTFILLADIQSIRDGIRAIFLPGFALVTFTLPVLLVGLFLRSLRAGDGLDKGQEEKEKKNRGSQLFDSSSPPPALNQQQIAPLAAKLIVSIIIDLIGDGSFLIPGAGEGSDLLWAPISALLVRFLYQSNVLSAVAFLEEILPFTDVIPTATLAFIFEVLFSEAGRKEQEEEERRRQRTGGIGTVIDVRATSEVEEEKK